MEQKEDVVVVQRKFREGVGLIDYAFGETGGELEKEEWEDIREVFAYFVLGVEHSFVNSVLAPVGDIEVGQPTTNLAQRRARASRLIDVCRHAMMPQGAPDCFPHQHTHPV